MKHPAQKEGLLFQGMLRKLKRYSDERKKGDWRGDWVEDEREERAEKSAEKKD